MRLKHWAIIALVAAASLTAAPAHAQFAAEDEAERPANADGNYEEATYGDNDPGADPYAVTETVDPSVADPAYATATPRSIGDRSVADVAASVLGDRGAKRAQDAEAIVRTVIGKAGSKGGTPGSPGTDPVGLVQDILTAARKTKDPQ